MEEDNPSDIVNLYAELGVSNERAHEISIEIRSLRKESENLMELLAAIPKGYDRESIIVGVFLGEIILDNDRRLLLHDSAIASKDEIKSGEMTTETIMATLEHN